MMSYRHNIGQSHSPEVLKCGERVRVDTDGAQVAEVPGKDVLECRVDGTKFGLEGTTEGASGGAHHGGGVVRDDDGAAASVTKRVAGAVVGPDIDVAGGQVVEEGACRCGSDVRWERFAGRGAGRGVE